MDVMCGIRHSLGFGFIKEHGIKVLLAMVFLLPLPMYNIAVNGVDHITFGYALSMFGVAIVEEVVFRGVLVLYTKSFNKYLAMLINGFVFGAIHFLNLISGAGFVYTAFQCLCAFYVGVALYSLRVRFQSIIPCIFLHFFINCTGNGETKLDLFNLIIIVAIGVYYIIYGFYMCYKSNNLGRLL